MTAINTSIAYQSQFAPSSSLIDMRTKSGAQSQMEVDLKPITQNYTFQSKVPVGEIGKHVNLKA